MLLLAASFGSARPDAADYTVQIGAFQDSHRAEQAAERLQDAGFPVATRSVQAENGQPTVRVPAGPYPEASAAASARTALDDLGWPILVRSGNLPSSPPTKRSPDQRQTPEEHSPGSPVNLSVSWDPKIPQSVNHLASLDEEAADQEQSAGAPESLDALFTLEEEAEAVPQPRSRVSGFFQTELAYTIPSPDHYSKFRNTLELATRGRLGDDVRWRASGRLVYDPIYDLTSFYNSDVRDDQRLEATIRETYLDISAGDLDFRIGRQHIIWGEMVALFFADVVSARDLREFLLPDFDMLRIPQWAVRGEYFKGDFHAEAVWIPIMTYDDIGKFGAEFYPFTPPAGATVLNERQPGNSLSNSAYGLRVSYLTGGWDTALFYYDSVDAVAAFERGITSGGLTFRPIHERIHQWGGTVAKDLGPLVFKGEAIYTAERLFSVTRASDVDGLVPQDFLDYIVGLEFSFPEDTRFNFQFFQRWFTNHDPDIVPDEVESGISFLFSTRALDPKVEPEVILVHSLNQSDWLLQAKATWEFRRNWRLVGGADVFSGKDSGLFGQFDKKDRIYGELRYSF